MARGHDGEWLAEPLLTKHRAVTGANDGCWCDPEWAFETDARGYALAIYHMPHPIWN